MSDEHLQKELKGRGYSDDYLGKEYGTEIVQALILGAYLDDKKKWEEDINILSTQLADKTKELVEIRDVLLKQARVKTILCKIFRIKTKSEKRFIQINEDMITLKNKLIRLTDTPPLPDAYELAILGNNLFKSR